MDSANLELKKDKSISSKITYLLSVIKRLAQKNKLPFNGERFYSDRELAHVQISRRKLQYYRSNGTLPYIKLKGKVIYRESDIQAFMEKHYVPAFRE